jgi:hypothetical protein
MHVLTIVHFKQRHALAAAFEKALPVALVIYGHAEEIDVELPRTLEVFDVEHDVVDAAYFER